MVKNALNILLLCVVLTSFKSDNASCDLRELKKKCKEYLRSYKYDSAKYTAIEYKLNRQKTEIEIPLFSENKYRFVFSTSNISKNVVVTVYNKSYKSRIRELLFSSQEMPDDQKEFYFDAEFSGPIYVNYSIPSVEGEGAGASECIAFMVGYKQ